MRPSDWLKERIEASAHHQKLVWVEDPYRLLDPADAVALREALNSSGHTLIIVTNAFRLREALTDLDGKAAASKVVVVDQSYTLRDPHLLPKDAKPSDLKPLPAPDWKPRVAADALLRPTVRDFLVSSTGVEDWPSEVNIYPYERLARERPVAFVRAYETFRRTGQTLTSDALVVVGASAVLGVDLFDIPGPILALELAFHSEPRWREVAEYFNTSEQRVVREHLRRLPAPLGELFGDNADTARSVVVSLLVLKQHFLDAPGKQLPFMSPALASYRECDVLPAGEAPPWLMEVEIPRFEKLLSKDFKDHLRDTLKLTDGDSARAFAQRERLSRELRGLVPFAVSTRTRSTITSSSRFRRNWSTPRFSSASTGSCPVGRCRSSPTARSPKASDSPSTTSRSFAEPAQAEDALDHLTGNGRQAALDAAYLTKCDRCGGPALTEFLIWSDTYQCPSCAELVPLYDCPEERVKYPDGSAKTKRVCPHCLDGARGVAKSEFVISTRSEKFAPQPVACKYVCLGKCRPKGKLRSHNDEDKKARRFFADHDVPAAGAITLKSIKCWYPKRRMMDVPKGQRVWGLKWRSGTANFEDVAELFTARNLATLAALREVGVASKAPLSPLIYLTWILHKCSNLMGCGADGVGRIGSGTYYVPPIRMEARPTKYLEQASRQILSHFAAKTESPKPGDFCLSIESNLRAFERLPEDSIDYVFTDPPYLNPEVQYGELNFLWDAWLDLPSSLKDEITLNPIHNHSWEEAENGLRQAMAGVYRVLKPGRWASICYHDTSEANWTMLQRAVLDAGFEIHTVTCLDPRSKSRKAITAEKIVKTDLVLNCRKPRHSRNPQAETLAHVSARVKEILLEELQRASGQTRDRLWDVVLKRLLSRGQMAEHRFDDVLGEVAFKSESGRWFLREEFESLSDNDIRNEEKAGDALSRFARLRMLGVPGAFAAEIVLRAPQLADHAPDEKQVERYIKTNFIKEKKEAEKFSLSGRLKGAEFYDCLFFYLTRWLKGRTAGSTPRRNLADFLDEYLVRFKDGDKWMYRAPDEAEAQSLKKARQTGLGRRIRQYVSFLKGEGEFPKEKMPDAKTLVAWLKHAAAFGLAEEGVLLWEKGGLIGQLAQLSEDERYDAEDYYAQCKRRAGKPVTEGDDAEDDGDEDEEGADE